MLQANLSQCPTNNCYTVQSGDTLYAISRFYNISLDDLIEANPKIEPDSLSPGQLIHIPLTMPSENCPDDALSYVVQSGDTIYSIARKAKIRLATLLTVNPNLNPDALLIGQSICIPIVTSVYSNKYYRIKLLYPYRWVKTNSNRYEGIDGFFQVMPISSDASLEDVCRSEAYHRLQPYGTHPDITATITAGLEACLITPSTDQPTEMRAQSALIARYENPVEIGGVAYQYILIHTDKNHLPDIVKSLELLDE